MPNVYDAIVLAKSAHNGQARKYSGEDYIVHPMRVAGKVSLYNFDYEEIYNIMVSAAWLHDVIEDTNIGYNTIRDICGNDVANLVSELTNVYTKEAYPRYNRRQRNLLEIERIKDISAMAQTIKLADRIDNLNDMPFSADFTVKYLKESEDLLQILTLGSPRLQLELENLIKHKKFMLNQLSGVI